jgi:hypothetical protein
MIFNRKIVLPCVLLISFCFVFVGCAKESNSVPKSSAGSASSSPSSDLSRGASRDSLEPDENSIMFKVIKIVGNEITGETGSYIIPVGIEISSLRGGDVSLSDISANTTLRLSFNESDKTLIEKVVIVSSQNQNSGRNDNEQRGSEGGGMNFGPPPGN